MKCKGEAVAITCGHNIVGFYLKISSFFLKYCYCNTHWINTLINGYIVIDLKMLKISDINNHK